MENLFSVLTEIVSGMVPALNLYLNWLLSDGLLFGLGIIVLPLLGKAINIFTKLRR